MGVVSKIIFAVLHKHQKISPATENFLIYTNCADYTGGTYPLFTIHYIHKTKVLR